LRAFVSILNGIAWRFSRNGSVVTRRFSGIATAVTPLMAPLGGSAVHHLGGGHDSDSRMAAARDR
jgi:hypothetical protein